MWYNFRTYLSIEGNSAHYYPLTIVGVLFRFCYPQGDTQKEAAQVLLYLYEESIMEFQELTMSDNLKIAQWLNLPLQEFLDMDIPLSTNDLICAGVIIKLISEDKNEN